MSTLRFNTWQNTGGTEVANSTLGTGKILQVVSTTLDTTVSATCGTDTTTLISGLSVSITPSSASSNIYVTAMIPYSYTDSASSARRGGFRLARNGSNLISPSGVGSRLPALSWEPVFDGNEMRIATLAYLDSPSTTSSTTYQIAATGNSSAGIIYVNRGITDTDGTSPRGVAVVTAMEVSA